jgi:hypothetical protein
MVQGVIGAALKEVLGGIAEALPKPAVGGELRLTVTLEIKDGKPVLKEGSEIQIDFHANMGGDG